MSLNFETWGLVDYDEASRRQLQIVEERAQGLRPDTIIFCWHPSIVTLGRGSDLEEYQNYKGKISESSRGGKATYHGPGQLVIYPIIKMKQPDVMAHLNWLEQITVDALKVWQVKGYKSREVNFEGGLEEESSKRLIPTGVWVENIQTGNPKYLKLASIGVAIKKWITYHGIAINLHKDPMAFKGINPCGFNSEVMTSLEDLLGYKVDKADFIEEFKKRA
jgi:lipoyl(octanoyl) transferase